MAVYVRRLLVGLDLLPLVQRSLRDIIQENIFIFLDNAYGF